MTIKHEPIFLLLINILLIIITLFFILPSFNIDIIQHNIQKNIDANVYTKVEPNAKKN